MTKVDGSTAMHRVARAVAAVALGCIAWLGSALVESPERVAYAATADRAPTIRQFSPQGEVALVRQARATFSASMVDFGDPKLASPFDVQCPVEGAGRWIDDRTWVHDFKTDVAPGTRCTFTLKAGTRTRDGALVGGRTSFTFTTGGPAIVRNFPAAGDGSQGIDEEQTFVLLLNGPATAASVAEHAWCEIEGIGERVGVRAVQGNDRAELLKRFTLTTRADRVVTLTCARRLPFGAKVVLVWGRGIASPSGIVTSSERRLSFEVRQDFTASFSCERENAQAACVPVRPMRLDFTAPISREQAERFVLRYRDGGKTIEKHPVFDADEHGATVSQVEFKPPFAEDAEVAIDRPATLVDDAGRALSNASLFPLKTRTAMAPPLVKFAAAPFGILELESDPVLPLTVRHVEAKLDVKGVTVPADVRPTDAAGSRGTVRAVLVDGGGTDATIIEWQRRIKRYHESMLPKDLVAREDLPPDEARAASDRPRVGANARSDRQQARADAAEERLIATRELSLLKRDRDARALPLPAAAADDVRPFEVIGIPLPQPGFHVVEVQSLRLGAALLGKSAPMYVRTTALVTNLGVHVKFGRVNTGVWVTSLDRAKPVADARVQISDCRGTPLWNGVTDARGFAFVSRGFPEPDYTRCVGRSDDSRSDDDSGGGEAGYFVSARKAIEVGPHAGKTDVAFVWSNSTQGIESWRFNLPSSARDGSADEGVDEPSDGVARSRLIAHTVFDRTLLRAGQTVSMKHFMRRQDLTTLAWPDAKSLPKEVVITHVGSEQKFTFDLAWRRGRYAETTFALPADAKLGAYDVALKSDDREIPTGRFRVEEFRLPVMRGRIDVRSGDDKARRDFVRPGALSAQVAVSYTNGGSAASLPVRVSAALKPHAAAFDGYDGYSFVRAEPADDETTSFDDFVEDGPRVERGGPGQRIVADKVGVTLDKDGAGRAELKDLPAIDAPRDLLVEATYPDPNGEMQTLSQTVTLWPAALAIGVKADDWVSVRGKSGVRLVVLDTSGKAVPGATVELRGVSRTVRSVRKRMVGGFYAYDNQRESKELGVLCTGKSNAQGLFFCDVSPSEAGNVELVARVKDAAGNVAESSASIWITRQADLWFGGENQDRIDVLPEKRSYAPGEVARFQVRMPFRAATALVAIERDGVMATQVVEIRGDDPTVSVKVEADWAPNVYVSVLAVRGRIREVPWYSFFTWGWKSPKEWWRAWRDEGRFYEAPTAMVDLGKPAFKYGIAAIAVDKSAHRLNVAVSTDRSDYPVRATAKARVRVTTADGKPVAAGTEVALAAVDEALLELLPNTSWNLLDAMIRERGYAVETATAQMQIIGKRHYGRKAVAPGGGGGAMPTRELFDTLLVWKPSVVLDADGSTTVDVPLNDSLTSFRIVAIADAETSSFGTGSATIRSRQDLQIVPGLPPLVREGDRYQAGITLRNTTRAAMDVDVSATATIASNDLDSSLPRSSASKVDARKDDARKDDGRKDDGRKDDGRKDDGAARAALPTPTALAPQRVHLDPDASRALEWAVVVPDHARSIDWRFEAKSSTAQDRIAIGQTVVPALPVTVQQATLTQVDRTFVLPVATPDGAALDADGRARGGLSIAWKPKLADGLPGVRDWFLRYPYGCLEQKASIALGTLDEARWDEVVRRLPLYLDNDGLANYFPPRAEDTATGSDVLTAYLLSASAEASRLGRYAIPDASRTKMESALVAFVEGRIKRTAWSPFTTDAQRQLDVRKLAAIEALSRGGKATPRMLQSLQIAPNTWPTSAVIDWLSILKRLPNVPDRASRLTEAEQILRARLTYTGTRLDFSTEKDDFWYWLMASGDGNAARLVLTIVDDPAWRDDAPRLMVGALQRQRRGHWLTTTANVWGVLAVQAFSRQFEREPVRGTARASLDGTQGFALAWSEQPQGGAVSLPWPTPSPASAASRRDLTVTQDGSGKPWVTVQSLAAVPLRQPFSAGYAIVRTVTPIERKDNGRDSRGDIVRIRLEVDAQADMTWVVVTDPVPGGATILGSGLGRDSQIATSGEQQQGWAWPVYEEKGFEAYRAYYRYVPKGKFSIEYTVRLNNVGTFGLPPTRVEAMYAPDVYGEVPNAAVDVQP